METHTNVSALIFFSIFAVLFRCSINSRYFIRNVFLLHVNVHRIWRESSFLSSSNRFWRSSSMTLVLLLIWLKQSVDSKLIRLTQTMGWVYVIVLIWFDSCMKRLDMWTVKNFTCWSRLNSWHSIIFIINSLKLHVRPTQNGHERSFFT